MAVLSGLVLAVLGAGTAGAHGPQLVDSAGAPLAGPHQNWVHASRMPVVDGTVAVHLEACPPRPELDGCVLFGSPRRIYLRPDSRWSRITLYHELGHMFDLELMDEADRRRFASLLGQPGQGWWDGEEPPAERFAEAYALCSRYRRLRAMPSWTGYGYGLSPRHHRRLCRRIRAAAWA
jgi:hypothetical protein